MGCCASKMDDSGTESGGPSSPPRQAPDSGSGYGGDGNKSINYDATPHAHAHAHARDAETAAIAAGIAHTLAQDDLPEGEAARPTSKHSNHALRNEPYFLPPTVFDPQHVDAGVDASVKGSVKVKEGKKKEKRKKKDSSSSSSSS